MINLLPPAAKTGIIYGRRNVRLRRWLVGAAAALASLIMVSLAGQLMINRSIQGLELRNRQAREQLKVQQLDETQKRVADISANLQLVVKVLQREVLFSKLITQIGAALPPGTVLSDLSIAKVQGGIDLKVNASDYQTASQVQLNLEDPASKIFDKADIVNINCGGTTAVDPRYPCQATLRARFGASNPFLFINSQPAAKP